MTGMEAKQWITKGEIKEMGGKVRGLCFGNRRQLINICYAETKWNFE